MYRTPSMLKLMLSVWAVLMGLAPIQATAADATSCIVLGDDVPEKTRTMKNNCRADVIVFWCHDSLGAPNKSSACDPDKKFYRQNSVLKSGDTKRNQYSLPLGANITFGACYGSWGDYVLLDGEGHFACLPQRQGGSGTEKRLLHTRAGADADSTCAGLVQQAQAYGRVGECSCETRGGVSLCRVESAGKGRDDVTLIQELKKILKDQLRDGSSKDLPNRSVSTGVRG